MTEGKARCEQCGQLLPVVSRSDLAASFLKKQFPKILDASFKNPLVIRTSKLNEQSDRKTYRWSFSKGTGSAHKGLWFWVGFDVFGKRIERAWLVPSEKWTTKVTHVSQYPTSQWAPFQCYPSEDHPKIEDQIMNGHPLTSRNFQRGQFRRYVSIMKFNIGSLSTGTNGSNSKDIEMNEYVHFDGSTLRFNGDSPNPQDWEDYPNVGSRTIISAINNGWLVEVAPEQHVDVSQMGHRPPSANIQMSPADPLKAQRNGQQWAPSGVIHQEDRQVGTVSGYVQQVNHNNQQAWDKRFGQITGHMGGNPVQVQQQQMPGGQFGTGGQMVTSSTAGMAGRPMMPQNQGPRFIANVPAPVTNHAAMNPMLSGGSSVEMQDGRPVNIPIRVPAKQTANIATGRINDDGIFDHRGQVAPRPAIVTAFTTLDQQGQAGMGMVRDRSGNIIGQSSHFQAPVQSFNPGHHPNFNQGYQQTTQPQFDQWGNQIQPQGQTTQPQFDQWGNLMQAQQPQYDQWGNQMQPQWTPQQPVQNQYQQPAMAVAAAHQAAQSHMQSEGISFQTQGIGKTAQAATGTAPQASPQFGQGQVVGNVHNTRGQNPPQNGHGQQFQGQQFQGQQFLQQGQLLDPSGNPMTPAARQVPDETPVMRNQDGSPIILNGPNGQPMMLRMNAQGNPEYVTPMVVAGPDGSAVLVPPGQTVSEAQLAASVPMDVPLNAEIDPDKIVIEEKPEVTAEDAQVAAAAAPPLQPIIEEEEGPPALHTEAIELLKGRKPVKGMETRIAGVRMFWPNFPENWPFKSKDDLRFKLAELHEEHPACLKAIYMAESTAFQAKMLERWPNLLTN